MSAWTDFRDKVEDALEPAIAEGITFLHATEALAESQGVSDVEKAAVAGYTAFEAAAGTAEAKLIAGLEAFGTTLLGYGISIVKAATTTAVS